MVFRSPSDTPDPVCVDYRKAARQLVPLIKRLACGEELTSQQLTTIVIDSWRVLEVAQKMLRHADGGDDPAE
jgi:hypothetical protein